MRLIIILISIFFIGRIWGLQNDTNNNFISNNTVININDETNYHWYIKSPTPLDLITWFVPINGVLEPIYEDDFEYRLDLKNAIAGDLAIYKIAGAFSDLLLTNPYPGYEWVYEISIGYQRYIWEGLYINLKLSPGYISYYNNNNNYLANGFQLFLISQIGYCLSYNRKLCIGINIIKKMAYPL